MRISDWSSDVCSSDLFRASCPVQSAKSERRVSGRSIPGELTSSLYASSIGSISSNNSEMRRERAAQSSIVSCRVSGRSAMICNVRSEEHTSELQSLMRISYAVFCLKKKNTTYYIKSTIRLMTTTCNLCQIL